MEKHKASPKSPNKNSNLKSKSQKIKAKLLNSYYGKPIKDLKLIAITGTTGKSITAHFVHEILNAAGQKVAVLASDQPFKTALLHKFFSDAWKAGADYVVVTTPATSLRNNVFYNLPVHIAAMTDFVPSALSDLTPEEYLADETTLFDLKPEIVIKNRDDLNFGKFADFSGTSATLTYGSDSASDLRINSHSLYKKGGEANFTFNRTDHFTTATFIPGEPAIHYMAAAAAIAKALDLQNEAITDGIANFNPEENNQH